MPLGDVDSYADAIHIPASESMQRSFCKLLILWWARRDLNPQPRDYESPALTVELQALLFIYLITYQ
jgi:hypothetical protein